MLFTVYHETDYVTFLWILRNQTIWYYFKANTCWFTWPI